MSEGVTARAASLAGAKRVNAQPLATAAALLAGAMGALAFSAGRAGAGAVARARGWDGAQTVIAL